jgi:hypothetical protein
MDPGSEERRTNQGQGGIFGATDLNASFEAFTPLNDYFVQSNPLQL